MKLDRCRNDSTVLNSSYSQVENTCSTTTQLLQSGLCEEISSKFRGLTADVRLKPPPKKSHQGLIWTQAAAQLHIHDQGESAGLSVIISVRLHWAKLHQPGGDSNGSPPHGKPHTQTQKITTQRSCLSFFFKLTTLAPVSPRVLLFIAATENNVAKWAFLQIRETFSVW